MNNRILRLLPVMLSASIVLSGCADNASVESETKALTVPVETTAVTTTEITAEEIQEVPYMEQFKDTIVELTPEEYEEKSESITYPVFKKYTYYSSTAERDTNVNVILRSRRGFISRITTGDSIMLFSFPKRYMNTPYFIPIVSAVLRSDERIKAAVHLGETVFGVSLENHNADNFAESLCRFISELGIYVAVSEIDIAVDELSSDINVDERITEMYCSLAEKNTPRSTEAYSEIFSNLRKEMKYSPQSRACSHKMNTQIFKHNFAEFKAKICRNTFVFQKFLTQKLVKFVKICVLGFNVNTL